MAKKFSDVAKSVRLVEHEVDFLADTYPSLSFSQIIRILIHRHVEELRGLRPQALSIQLNKSELEPLLMSKKEPTNAG